MSSAMALPKVTFESLAFSDGTAVSLDLEDIVVFVGPNNAGKSAALRELELHIGAPVQQTVVKTAKLVRSGSVEELHAFLKATTRITGTPQHLNYTGHGLNVSVENLAAFWQDRLDIFRPLFCKRIATEGRITGSNPTASFKAYEQDASDPIQLLFADDRIETRLSSYFNRGFGHDLIVFRGGSSEIPLVIGQRPVLKSGEDRVAATYIERLRARTKPLKGEGDGMRSFATVILELLARTTHSVLLLDEPEAFLHPPQARLLGELIASDRPPASQLFIATHSPDVLQGLLKIAPHQLRIIRLQRDGDINRVKELDKAKAKRIGADPLMKYSSVLSGVFHERVIVCEADADCMFYNAILDLPQICGPRQPDVHFVHGSGKHRIAALTEAMHDLGVTVDAIVDMDVLNDETVLERLVVALGGPWDEIKGHAIPLKKAIEEHKSWLNAPEVVKGIEQILIQTPASGEFPKNLKKEISAVFKKASPWDAIKDAGEAIIPSGQATQHYEKMKGLCASCGLWIVPVGEIENFNKSIGGDGPRWVQQVLETCDLASDPKLALARAFVKGIWVSKTPH